MLCVHIETSSLWAEFVNKNRCISVRLYLRRIKAFNFDNFDNSCIIVSYDQNISQIIFVKTDSMSGCDIRLVFTFPPKENAYTSEITFLALVPWYNVCTSESSQVKSKKIYFGSEPVKTSFVYISLVKRGSCLGPTFISGFLSIRTLLMKFREHLSFCLFTLYLS